MMQRLEFAEVFKVDGYGLIVNFNDGTYAEYTVDELSNMRPVREHIEKVKEIGSLKPSNAQPGAR